jgi:hypothetical protein
MNKTIYDVDDDDDDNDDDKPTSSRSGQVNTSTTVGDTNRCCNCRETLFDRSAFIQSYFDSKNEVTGNGKDTTVHTDNHSAAATTATQRTLKAIIFGTYTVDDRTLQEEFPNLFIENYNSCNTNVPCLVLYGKRNSIDDAVEVGEDIKNSHVYKSQKDDVASASSSMDEETGSNCGVGCPANYNVSYANDDDDDDDDTTSTKVSALETQDEITAAIGSTPYITTSYTATNVHMNPHQQHNNNETIKAFPKMVHFSQITSSWYKDMNELLLAIQSSSSSSSSSKATFDNLVDPTTGYLLPTLVARRTNIPFGVHHSKYIICFESDGSIVICITTANLTSPQTTDATWIQRFAPSVQPIATDDDNIIPNDFGRVLTNYLQCTMLATAPDHKTIHWFVQTYLQWKSIRQLERKYNFDAAQVQLVTVIPGDFPKIQPVGNSTDSKNMAYNDDKQRISFSHGQERISLLLQQLELSLPSKHRNLLYTNTDKIIIQPTSFGGGWNVAKMAQLIRSYLGCTNTLSDQELLRRLDIVWPTNHFVQRAKEQMNVCYVRQWNLLQSNEVSNSERAARIAIEPKNNGGFLFYSSEAFNNNDLTCLNRMVLFEASRLQTKQQGRTSLIPHFKSVTRLIGQQSKLRTKYPKLQHCDDYLSWFLLTSACLSRGAQGEETVQRFDETDGTNVTMMAYSNFEMGVLFSSFLSGGSKMDRIYCFNAKSCSRCHQNTIESIPRLIHLPVPYRLRPSRYVDDEDMALFDHTPYFHEVVPGTGCEGNMLLTPYGQDVAAKLSH